MYNPDQPRPDLKRNNPEELIDYSIQLGINSEGYASKVNVFKSSYIKAAKNMDVATQHQKGLAAIKNLIETHSWKLGSWGSCSKIEVNGVPKEIPKHIYQIYKTIENVEKQELDPTIALTEIGNIADHALKNAPTWFKSLRGRDQETTDVYTEISKLSHPNN
ncbi:hypothetical protein [Legionella waltersii]|nr:hypothetical protein [Legionella waltersii]